MNYITVMLIVLVLAVILKVVKVGVGFSVKKKGDTVYIECYDRKKLIVILDSIWKKGKDKGVEATLEKLMDELAEGKRIDGIHYRERLR